MQVNYNERTIIYLTPHLFTINSLYLIKICTSFRKFRKGKTFSLWFERNACTFEEGSKGLSVEECKELLLNALIEMTSIFAQSSFS